jgi:hypothetical protein
MQFTLSIMYFFGLIMFGVSFAVFRGIPEFGFMIIGGGTIVYPVVIAIVKFLKPRG